MAKKYNEGEQYRIYAIPYNFIDESKMFGGMFKTRNFVEGAILSAFVILPIIFIPMHSLVLKASLLMFFGMPPIIFGVVGLNNDALSTFIMYYMKYRKKKRKVYFNSRVKTHSVVDIEEGLQAELPRDKVMKLFGPIINKKGEEDQEDELNEDFVFDDDIDNTIRKRKEKHRKDDYSTDLLYEGFEFEEITPVQELEEFDSQMMKSGGYEREFFQEEEDEPETPSVIECDDYEIIEELELIGVAEEGEELAEDDIVEEVQTELLEPEILEELEILEIIEDEYDALTEEKFEPEEAKIEPMSEVIAEDKTEAEDAAIEPETSNQEPEIEEEASAPIDIMSFAKAKTEEIENEVAKELTRYEMEVKAEREEAIEEPAAVDSAPEVTEEEPLTSPGEDAPEEAPTVESHEDAHVEPEDSETEEDEEDQEGEGDTPESGQAEGPVKAKRKRKRRRKKKPAVEGGEHIE